MYLLIYLVRYLFTYLLKVQMLTKYFIEIQRNILNVFGIILFYKVVWWFDGQDIGLEQGSQGSIFLTNIYYVEYVYSYIYIVHLCKCIILRWVVEK